MTELAAAIGIAQLKKVASVVARRNHLGTMLTDLISDIDGLRPAPVTPGGMHSYWAYPLYLEDIAVETFLDKLKSVGISSAVHMSKPVYHTAVHLSARQAYGDCHCPFTCGRSIEYADGLCPKAEALSSHLVTLWLTENWSESYVLKVSKQIREIVQSMH